MNPRQIRDFEPDGLFDDVRLYSRLSSLLERLFTEVIEEPELPLITDDDNPHDVFKEASVAASERGRAKLLGQYVRLLQTFFALPEVVERCTAQASGALPKLAVRRTRPPRTLSPWRLTRGSSSSWCAASTRRRRPQPRSFRFCTPATRAWYRTVRRSGRLWPSSCTRM